jgi:acetyl-CoA acyltransferase
VAACGHDARPLAAPEPAGGTGAVIVDAVRTPLGRPCPDGAYSRVAAWWLLAGVLGDLVRRAGVDAARVRRLLLTAPGEPAGAPVTGRRAWRAAGLQGVPRIETADRRLPPRRAGSGQDLVHRAVRAMAAGRYDLAIVAGADAAPGGPAPEPAAGIAAELLAARHGLGRRQLDDYADRSRRHSAEVAALGEFRSEIVPVRDPAGRTPAVTEDETVGAHAAGPDPVEPLFRDERVAARYPQIGWDVTAANSAVPATGAVAVLLATQRFAAEHGLRPRAAIAAVAEHPCGAAPRPHGMELATRAVLAGRGLGVDDMDHYEVSETFAAIALAWQRQFDADLDRFNPRGGAIGLGRLAGAAGLRSMTTMLGALEDTGGSLGLQVMDEAGGRFSAMVVRR